MSPPPSTLLVQLILQVLNFSILAGQYFAGYYFRVSLKRASSFAAQVLLEHTKRLVKVLFLSKMRLYFLMFITAVCFSIFFFGFFLS